MSAREIKLSKTLPKDGLADFFAELSTWLSGQEAAEGLPKPGEVASLKLRVEDAGSNYTVKVKIKRTTETEAAQAESAPPPVLGYKTLKKKLRANMKSLAWYVSENRLPPGHELEGFLNHCLAMTKFPGKGEEYYAPFLATLEQLKAAVAAQDFDLITTALQQINRVKKECHAKYK